MIEAQSNYDRYLSSLATSSQAVYRKRRNEYLNYCEENGLASNVVQSLHSYLEMLHSDEFDFAASSLWTICSILSTWFHCEWKIRPLEVDRILEKKLKNWTKEDSKKKSAVLTKDELQKYFEEVPNDSINLWKKVAAIIGIFGFTRKKELTNVEFEDLTIHDDVIIVDINRKKQVSSPVVSQATITDKNLIDIVKQYVNCFPESARSGRLFHKMNDKMVPNRQNIGENPIAHVPKDIASFLNKPNLKEYTSHCFRRTAATILAESGASLSELKIAGAWNSSTVAESYIATSLRMKRTISDKMKIVEKAQGNTSVPSLHSNPDKTAPNNENNQQIVINHPNSCTFNFQFSSSESKKIVGDSEGELVLKIPKFK